MVAVIKQTVRAWLIAAVALCAAAAGMVSLIAGNSVVSTTRMGVAAAVLAAYAAAVAIVFTDRAERTRLRCLVWGVAVPLLVGVVNAVLVVPAGGAGRALVTALPWLIGAVLVSIFGPSLPGVRAPAFLRRNREPEPEPEQRY